MKKVALHTLGCKLNFSETSSIGRQFINNGFEIVDFNKQADVYVINTCTVTENAERDCRQVVRRALRTNPEAYVLVTGCYAQLRPDEIANIEGVDIVLGSREKFDVFAFIDQFEKKDLACIFVSPTEDLSTEFGFASSGEGDNRTRAYFKIQDGCDYKCTFCTIPLARGGSRSMDPEKAVDKLSELLDSGYKEIILTGVNVGDYGKKVDSSFYKLLLKLTDVPGNFRLRISSIEPNLLTDPILELTAGSEKMAKHFHIPLQSGSPTILRLMQRRYNTAYYEKLIHRATKMIPNLGIGVDVITGFPGEGEKEFTETHHFLLGLPVSYFHVFTYSERPRTKAINMPGIVDVTERKRRTNVLRIVSQKKKNEFFSKMIGKEVDVLFEQTNHGGSMKGFSSEYIKISHPHDSTLTNKFTKFKILSHDGEQCLGEVVEKELVTA
ncbi:MAG: tRNA (N(6)-L-threonylcarbamoyladenosine(37)-C(2))-methylthiotransferase MtaB [Ignavibacteriales bacterium]|nr:MAG: tRNA (N(6)-L-threonylcarbamoyladenosine(37)-C(2))-methylthiotransferase MtaB [Ignavibacteriaceae bacterium]MBW7872018.1 tRNA (N(6)-L-threonylcarbamoyladenosine(37)-C(2))-methylthiotransferase MtaB [Ignavibacteria bacterium]MCZ2144114.1 tRNA (N(6)-L-threonylcarbamoyladenosine(37)-C(2))-methylthiotransferase MtaB [Ignavibacteriales bacterium]OQY72589.1 MAG: tRNA (N(6)-L-threonylcarbamoyladenosine(37)-C(2))-methylthiotransferase MtaB [Ignavibacteriales bacterium UTCHB3]MBV6446085.1 Threony